MMVYFKRDKPGKVASESGYTLRRDFSSLGSGASLEREEERAL